MPAGAAAAEAPLGILAGGSGLPIEIAEAVMGRGRGVHIVGLRGEAEPGISRFPHTWVEWGGVGAILTAFRAAGCRDIVIVGRVRRPNLTRIRPDLGFWRALPSVLSSLRGGDDAILRMVVGFFESHGLVVRGAHQAAPELIAPSGPIGTRQPGPAEREAIARRRSGIGRPRFVRFQPGRRGRRGRSHSRRGCRWNRRHVAPPRGLARCGAPTRSQRAADIRRRARQAAEGRPGAAHRPPGDRARNDQARGGGGAVRHRGGEW